MASLRLKDLHPVYQTVSHEEARVIANLGAQTYMAAKEGLFDVWNSIQSAEEGTKADVWRKEGGQSMLEGLKSRLAAGDAAVARVATLQASIDAEIERRIGEVVELQRKDYEISKMEEVAGLRAQLAMAEGKSSSYKMVEEAHASMKLIIDTLQKEVAKYKDATSTKSSYALGKIGEA